MTADERYAELRKVALVADVREDLLRQVAEGSELLVLEPGEDIFREGTQPEFFFFILDGRVESLTRIDGDDVAAVEHGQYTYAGAISLISGNPYPGTTRVLARTRVIRTPAELFWLLIREDAELRKEVFSRFQPIYQRWGQIAAQREKLAALGELSAGLAHELNNPAAAAGRAAQELGATLAQVQQGIARFAEAGLSPDQLAKLAATAGQARDVALAAEPLDALERSDREDEIAQVLEEHGVEDAWDLAADLVEVGMDRSCAVAIAENAGEQAAPQALTWVAAGARAEALARELAEATERISALVRAVKEYTYLDQAPSQDVDVHRGLETTLTVLGHKLKKGDIEIVRELQPDLPHIHAYGSELNQVWTNLLDNAIDALQGEGTITLRSCTDGPDHVLIEVADSGPGIPQDVQSRIFEPFFTTKGVGEGTGMGLDVVYRIVVQRHGGDVRVQSEPGSTRFLVRLPRQPHEARSRTPAAASAGSP